MVASLNLLPQAVIALCSADVAIPMVADQLQREINLLGAVEIIAFGPDVARSIGADQGLFACPRGKVGGIGPAGTPACAFAKAVAFSEHVHVGLCVRAVGLHGRSGCQGGSVGSQEE